MKTRLTFDADRRVGLHGNSVAPEVSPLTSSLRAKIRADSCRLLQGSWSQYAFGLFCVLWLTVTPPPLSAADFSWQRETNTVALVKGEQVIWRFLYGPGETKTAFHPVALPGGPVLTEFRPADHPWHRGLWFSWKFINGVNYWEENKKTGEPDGRTVQLSARVETRGDFAARAHLQLAYQTASGSRVMTEQRVIAISPPDAQGVYTMDWTHEFTAVADVLLDRTPLPGEPDGKPYGGYAGLSVRLANVLSDARLAVPQGTAEFEQGRYRGKAGAMDYSGVIEGREVGIAILDHPANPNAPSPWYAINSGPMRYFSPAVICYQPHRLKAGEKLTLRYRVLVHSGRWDAGRLSAEIQRYTRGGAR